jgi:hypothetical protein
MTQTRSQRPQSVVAAAKRVSKQGTQDQLGHTVASAIPRPSPETRLHYDNACRDAKQARTRWPMASVTGKRSEYTGERQPAPKHLDECGSSRSSLETP